MAQALNCNRCNAFISLAQSDKHPNENPATGWVTLRIDGAMPASFDGSDWLGAMGRRHLCPECVKALEEFVANKPIEPALHCGTLKMNMEMFAEIMEDPKSFVYDVRPRKP